MPVRIGVVPSLVAENRLVEGVGPELHDLCILESDDLDLGHGPTSRALSHALRPAQPAGGLVEVRGATL